MLKTNIPAFIYITSGAVHEIKALDYFPLESGSFYIMDKAYIDFGRLYHMHESGAFFILRSKENFKFVRLSSRQVDKSTGIKCDQQLSSKTIKYPGLILKQ